MPDLFAAGCIGLVILGSLVIMWQYGRIIRQKDQMIKSLQGLLEDSHKKLMTIDFEKFAEMQIQADAVARETWIKATKEITDPWGPDVQDPVEIEVLQHAFASDENS